MENDVELLTLAKRLDKEALIKIFDLYSVPIYRYALRLCNDPVTADQVVGDVFAKLLDQFSSGKGPNTNLRSYLFEIAYHQVINELPISHRNILLEEPQFITSDANVSFLSLEDQLLSKQMLLAIQNDLTADQRHVIILRFLEGFSLKETALILGKTIGNIKVIQNRAMAMLRKVIEGKDSKIIIPIDSTIKADEILRL